MFGIWWRFLVLIFGLFIIVFSPSVNAACVDKVKGCSRVTLYHCFNAKVSRAVTQNCQRTCGLCKVTPKSKPNKKGKAQKSDIGLRVRGSNGKMYVPFYSSKNYFSNRHPVKILYVPPIGQPTNESFNFPTAQHYFAFVKAMSFADIAQAQKIKRAKTADEAMALSFKLKKFTQWKWDATSYNLMLFVLRAKFTQNFELRRALKKTGTDTIVYAHTGDRRWGVGIGPHDSNIANPKRWKGQNLLGKALMRIRDII